MGQPLPGVVHPRAPCRSMMRAVGQRSKRRCYSITLSARPNVRDFAERVLRNIGSS